MPNRGVTLSSYDPSLRDRLSWMIGDLFGDDRTMRNWAQDRVRGAADFLPVVGDAIGFDEAKRDFDAGNYGQAALGGTLSAVGSVPGLGDALAAGAKAGGSALGMFIGPMAKTWRSDMHEKAMDMNYDGRTPDEIWAETKSYFDPNQGRWMQEIPDLGSYVGRDVGSQPKDAAVADLVRYGFPTDVFRSAPLDETMYHPALFDAYPELRGVGIAEEDALRSELKDTSGQRGYGTFVPNPSHWISDPQEQLPNSLMGVRSNMHPTGNPRVDAGINPHSTMLHEIQHWIQNREGFDPGTDPSFIDTTANRPDSFFSTLTRRLGREKTQELVDKGYDYDLVRPMVEEQAPNIARYETYLRDAGETQARNTQARMGMLPKTLDRLPPWATQDRDFNEQLTIDDIRRGVYSYFGVPGLSLRAPAIRER